VVIDEAYHEFAGHSVVPLLLDHENLVVLRTFSKAMALAALRVGYLLADSKWLGSIGYFHDLLYVCAPAPFQHGCADGVEQLGPEFYANLAHDHEAKRTMIVDALRIAGMTPHVPDGAYYVLASTGDLPGNTAAEKARALLAKTGVAAVAGSAFFRPGKGEDLLRFCFAKKDADLAEACRRLKAFAPK